MISQAIKLIGDLILEALWVSRSVRQSSDAVRSGECLRRRLDSLHSQNCTYLVAYFSDARGRRKKCKRSDLSDNARDLSNLFGQQSLRFIHCLNPGVSFGGEFAKLATEIDHLGVDG